MRGLYQRPGSPIWCIRYADQHGRIRRLSTGTTEKKLAASILAKKKTEVAENRHLDVKKFPSITFHKFCDQYWEVRGSGMKTNGLDYQIEIFKEYFGNPMLLEITPQKIERFLTEQREEKHWAISTRNRHLTVLKALFTKAVEWGFLETNPAAIIKGMKGEEPRMRFLTVDEIEKLLAEASKRFRPLLEVALHTGMRRGEIFRLRWSDIDFQNGLITVKKSKSGKPRSIPMDETIANVLRQLPTRFNGGLVFPSMLTGEELTDINGLFPMYCKRAGIENVHFHDLRHTFASHLVMSGVDIRTVQELLGHATLNMTMRYAHLAPEHRTKAVKVLDTVYGSDTKTDTQKKA